MVSAAMEASVRPLPPPPENPRLPVYDTRFLLSHTLPRFHIQLLKSHHLNTEGFRIKIEQFAHNLRKQHAYPLPEEVHQFLHKIYEDEQLLQQRCNNYWEPAKKLRLPLD